MIHQTVRQSFFLANVVKLATNQKSLYYSEKYGGTPIKDLMDEKAVVRHLSVFSCEA